MWCVVLLCAGPGGLSGSCLAANGSAVTLAACSTTDVAQHWLVK
jgi:hypothetical protein